MQQRPFGRTGLTVSVLGFGCGAVGGLMVRGDAADQARAVARAVEAGITYFDTAASYGDGLSESNLGRVLKSLRPNVLVGTKVGIPDSGRGNIAATITRSLEASLRRLGRDSVDLFQLHNPVTAAGVTPTLSLQAVLEEAVPALDRLRQQGKTRFIGITAIGDAAALRAVAESNLIHSMQIPFNLLNPSAALPLPAGLPAHDFDRLMQHAHDAGIGTIGIRVLAGGALSGETTRHPIGVPSVEPIGSGADYAADVARARRLLPLLAEGHAGSLVELAQRFVISTDALSTVLIGTSTLDELETAIASIEKGPLSEATLARIRELI